MLIQFGKCFLSVDFETLVNYIRLMHTLLVALNAMKNRAQSDMPLADRQNAILRKAEHTISYSAKRAIEMYFPVWEKEPAWYLFLKCAEHYHLCQVEIEQCKDLMEQFGMVEEGA